MALTGGLDLKASFSARSRAGLPVSVGVSLAVHVGLLGGYLYMNRPGPEENLKVITDVDLLLAQPGREAPAKPRAPASIKDFLKLALPSAPKPPSGLMELREPRLDARKLLDAAPKLEDRGKLETPKGMQPLDLSARRESLAKIQGALAAERRAPGMLEAPKLEEVGMRQAPKAVLRMAALEEENRERLKPQGLQMASADLGRSRPSAAAPLLAPEASAPRLSGRGLGGELPDSAAPAALAQATEPLALRRERPAEPLPSLPRREEGLKQAPRKKAVEIEGPLSNRKVVAYSVPEFPAWARDQGILQADVAIRFYVDPAGLVLDGLRVERTSGYGRLDRLAMETLKSWRFAPLADGNRRNEWGVITFRFVLE